MHDVIEGRHMVEVVRHSVRCTPNGTEYVSVQCKTVDDPDESFPVKCSLWLTDKAIKMAVRQLAIMGFDARELDLDVLQDEPELLAGNRFAVEVEYEEWKGKEQMRVNVVMGSLTKERVNSLSQKLRNAATGADDDVFNEAAKADDEIPI